MCTLTVTFFPPEHEGKGNKEHFEECLNHARETLESVGIIASQYPDMLLLRLECPTEHIVDIVRFLTLQTKIGIAKVIPVEHGEHVVTGGEG